MRQVFISYARDDRRRVEALAERLRRLVDGVWFDSQLHGGEDWWAGILGRIRTCDIFLAVVTHASLRSQACRIEREYAAAANRTIVPVALEPVPPALPRDVATLQIVDFSTPGEQALSDLARALLAVPEAEPLPEPLPPEPQAPLSYLTDLVDLVNSPRELTKSEQMEILFRLERGLESVDHDEREGACHVLQQMQTRDDLAASVEKTISLLARDHVPRVPAEASGDSHSRPRPSPPPPTALTAAEGPTEPGPAPANPPAETGSPGRRHRWPIPVAVVGLLAIAIAAVVTTVGWPPGARNGDAQNVVDVTQDDSNADEAAEAAPLPTQQTHETVPSTSPLVPSPIPVKPPPLPVDAGTRLQELAEQGAKELSTIPIGTWVPQVSSKCTPLTSLDYQDADGRVGRPDGQLETFPNGITDEQILAFHEGLATRLGLTTDEVILVTPDDLGIDGPAPQACGSTKVWISLVATEQSSARVGALGYCASTGLPFGECGARSIGPDTQFALPSGEPPDPGDLNTYPVLVTTYLSVRTSPSVDAPEVGRVPAGGYVTIVCTIQGDAVTDPFGDVISLWDKISKPFGGYVSDAFVDTGGRPPVMPAC